MHDPYRELQHHARQATMAVLVILFGLVLWFALTADTSPAVPTRESPARTTQDQGISEQLIVMNDGRTVLCLSFPGPGHVISCDWPHAHRSA
jgi:hypothetical protein